MGSDLPPGSHGGRTTGAAAGVRAGPATARRAAALPQRFSPGRRCLPRQESRLRTLAAPPGDAPIPPWPDVGGARMTTTSVPSPLKWIGGKHHLAQRILAAFPAPHCYDTYHEPCGGAAHVLLRKPNWGHREIYNDLNDDLCNFWRHMQDHAEELVARLAALPYSRALYYQFHLRLFDGGHIEPLERAVLWFYVLRGT